MASRLVYYMICTGETSECEDLKFGRLKQKAAIPQAPRIRLVHDLAAR